jgi:HemY protein
MKAGLYIAAALVLGALLANLLLTDPGYVAVRFAGRLVEMSAVTFALLLIALYALVRLVVRVVRARRLWREAQRVRRFERARRALAKGLLEMAEGEWETAENTLTQAILDAEAPMAQYLSAARAAELQNAPQRRDDWLAKAMEISEGSKAPALIMQAEMHLKHKQPQAALAALEQLEARGEQNARGLLLLARIYRQTGDWQRLEQIEPRLRTMRGITTAVADETVAQIYLDRLKAAGAAENVEELRSAWKQTPKSLSQRPEIVVSYARAAMACDEHEEAELELRKLIEHRWDEAAVVAYGELDTEAPLETLQRAEAWLLDRREDPVLLLTCARLCMLAELYGKSRSYLETSIAIRPRLDAYQLLASLMEQLGERERAAKALNDALVLAVGRKAIVPKIRSQRWVERRHNDRRR